MIPRQSFIVIATCALLFTIPACTLPTNTPPSSGGNAAPITQQPLPPPINTKTMTATTLPTLDPQAPLTFGGAATVTVTPSPTGEALPPIPNFDEVLTFGGGGGGGFCPGVDLAPNNIDMSIEYGKFIALCLYLNGLNYEKSFQIDMEQIGGSRSLTSPNLILDTGIGIGQSVRWEGYQEPNGHYWTQTSGALSIGNIILWWPIYLPTGRWRINVLQQGSGFVRFSADFDVEDESQRPYINALSSRPENQIVPAYIIGGQVRHAIKLKNDREVEVVGINFPAKTQIYILLYRQSADTKLSLVDVVPTLSDFNGFLKEELSGHFEPGQSYVIVGISDPSTDVGGESDWFDYNLPFDYFEIESPGKFNESNSCPGAPPQRMIINQRGYTCTKSDDVRLRDAPFRSANTINYLPVGSQFTVLDGPSCADNWSWWQIRTDYGVTGWIAEGGDQVDPYFICPMP